MKRRYKFMREVVGCGRVTAAFVAVLNELSDLPSHKVGFMHIIWDMGYEHDR